MELDKRFNWTHVEDDIRLYALSLGISFRQIPMDDRRSMHCLPVTAFPTPLHKSAFQLANNLQPSINELIHKISTNHQFLEQTLLKLPDEFVAKLFNIYETVTKEGYAASHQLGIFRSDYMIDEHQNLKQVEVNTISSGLCAMTQQVTKLHRYTLKYYQGLDDDQIDRHIAVNKSLEHTAQSLIDAHLIYSSNASSSAILFVVQEQEANVMDQKMIEWKMKPFVQSFRRSFRELDNGNISLGPNKQLLLTVGNEMKQEISVVYFRAAYSSSCFRYENSWKLRLLIEQSRAIKCPSIQLQLAGFKQFQPLLSDRTIFDRFCCHPNADQLYDTFAKFYTISPSSRDMVAENSSGFVLKSNQEGGGNNVFGEQIVAKLDEMLNQNEKDAHFLM
ncbi:glutathione synthetase-like protein, partial [Euroglyphus maynei]